MTSRRGRGPARVHQRRGSGGERVCFVSIHHGRKVHPHYETQQSRSEMPERAPRSRKSPRWRGYPIKLTLVARAAGRTRRLPSRSCRSPSAAEATRGEVPLLKTKRAVPPGHPLRNYVRCSSCRCRSWRRARGLRLLTACSGVPTVRGACQEYAHNVSPVEGPGRLDDLAGRLRRGVEGERHADLRAAALPVVDLEALGHLRDQRQSRARARGCRCAAASRAPGRPP